MNQAVSENSTGATDRNGQGDSIFLPIRLIDAISRSSGYLCALALLVMTGIVCYEITSRYVFNAPTSWVTEIATYMLVGITFMSLGAIQNADGHIQVELLPSLLRPRARRTLELVATWTGLAFVVVVTWQACRFNYTTFINDTRDWGLLRTPLWIPQLFVSLGYVIFALALIATLYRLRPPKGAVARWSVPVIGVLLAGALLTIELLIGGSGEFQSTAGMVSIALALLVAMPAWSGWRIAGAVAALYAAVAGVFWLAQDYSLVTTGLLLVGALLVMLLLGVRVALALGITGMFGVYLLLPSPQLSMLAERSWTSINSFSLTAVPMFVFMGGLLLRSGIMTDVFDALMRWSGRLRGGIAYASVVASTFFAAVSGSSLATAATLGTVACPEMIRRGYSPRLTFGVVAAGATLGILIPPSIAMIIYGTTVGAPVTLLFMAGIVPGVMLMAALMAGVLGWTLLTGDSVPRGEPCGWYEKLRALSGGLPFIVVIIVVLGSLYAGIATPTEAGAMGAAIALVLCALRGRFSIGMLIEAAQETVKVSGFLLFLVVGASMMSVVFDYLQIPRYLVDFLLSQELRPWLLMAALLLLYIIMGMFIDPISMMLMTLPVTFPLVTSMGFDEIWFGVVLVLIIEVGLITPPVGMVLFVLRGMSGDVPLREIVYGVLPFMLIILAFIIFLYLFPEVVQWLPNQIE